MDGMDGKVWNNNSPLGEWPSEKTTKGIDGLAKLQTAASAQVR
jgi:hypothetical protein